MTDEMTTRQGPLEREVRREYSAEDIARLGGTFYTIQDHVSQAKEWGEKLPYYPGMTGWRTTCRALAEEVERCHATLESIIQSYGPFPDGEVPALPEAGWIAYKALHPDA